MWNAAKLRFLLSVPLNTVSADSRVMVYPLDRAVTDQGVGLAAIHEMHDRQIVSTALVWQSKGEIVSLLTCDKNITASGFVPIVW